MQRMASLPQSARKILEHVLDVIVPLHPDDAVVRQMPEDHIIAFLAKQPSFMNDVAILRPLDEPLMRILIHGLKYRKQRMYAEMIGMASASVLKAQAESAIMVPVPASIEGRRERGYNQSLLIADAIAQTAGAGSVVEDLLERTDRRRAQTTVKSARKRRDNMKGAFICRDECRSDRTYLIIDDVSTTGATLLAAKGTLQDAGARNILLFAAAQAPLH